MHKGTAIEGNYLHLIWLRCRGQNYCGRTGILDRSLRRGEICDPLAFWRERENIEHPNRRALRNRFRRLLARDRHTHQSQGSNLDIDYPLSIRRTLWRRSERLVRDADGVGTIG